MKDAIWSTGKQALYESWSWSDQLLQIIGPVVDLQVCGEPAKNDPQRVFQLERARQVWIWVAAFDRTEQS